MTVGLTAGDLIELKDGVREGALIRTSFAGTFLRDGDIVSPSSQKQR